MSGGVIRIPKSYTAQAVSWAVPGTWCMWRDKNRLCIRPFRIMSVTDDATYVYIQTSETRIFPSYDSSAGGKLYIRTHPAPNCTITNCSGTAPAGTDDGGLVYGMSLAPDNLPMRSFARLKFNGNTNPNVQHEAGSFIYGRLVSLSMDVTTEYAGSTNPARMNPLSGADWMTKADGTISNYIPEINIRHPGERTLVVTGGVATPGGAQTGDSFGLPEDTAFFSNGFDANMEHDIRSDHESFSMTVTIRTDQGLSPPTEDIFVSAGDGRTIIITPEIRALAMLIELRSAAIVSESRSLKAPE